jgi:hypothetical protein
VSDENVEKRPAGGILTRGRSTPWAEIAKKSIAAVESVGKILTDKQCVFFRG